MKEKMVPEAILFDRDGTLIEDKNFVHKIKDLKFFPRIIEALQNLDKKTKIIIVTNQAGIGKGIYTKQEYFTFRDHIHTILKEKGITIAAEYYCPHHPKGISPYNIECQCRKPNTALFEQAIQDFNLNPKNCWTIGDMRRDIVAGQRVGMKAILVKTGFAGKGGSDEIITPEYTAEDVYDAVKYIKKYEELQ
ncbi:MAG: HAD family hydrolase [Candidatus Woesearchaeota archaeon]